MKTDKSKKKDGDDKMDADNKKLVNNTIELNPELEESSLNLQQRRQRAMTMRKHRAKIASARKRMARRPADRDRLQKRAKKSARNMVKKQITGSSEKSYNDMSAAEKKKVDDRVNKRGAIVARLAKRLLPQMKKNDRARIAGKSVTEQVAINETPTVERVKDRHANEREKLRDRQEQEMDQARTNVKRRSIRAINREQVEIETDADALVLIHHATINEQFDQLMEFIELEKVIGAVERMVAKGADPGDAAWDVSRAAGVTLSSKEILKAYQAKAKSSMPDPVKQKRRLALKRRYGFKEQAFPGEPLTEMTNGDVNKIMRATKNEIAKLRKSDLPIDQEDADRLEYSFMPALNARNLSQIMDAMTRGDTEYRETVFRLVSGVIGKEATWKLHEGYDADGYTPSGPAGAGLESTGRLTKRYKKDTPGEASDDAIRKDVNEMFTEAFRSSEG